MVPSHAHDHAHSPPGHIHGHHTHSHGPAAPHPAQAVAWSVLRMTVASRLMAAMAVAVALWAIVWLAMR